MNAPPTSLPQGCVLVSGFEHYCVRSDGTVFSCRGRGGLFRDWTPMTWCWNKKGTPQARAFVGLRKDRGLYLRKIHLLVLEAFGGPRPEGFEACHNDGNPEHNHIYNLRWDTHKGNMADRERHGTVPQGSRNGSAVLTDESVRHMRRELDRGSLQKDLAPIFGVSKQCVQLIAAGKTWRHLI